MRRLWVVPALLLLSACGGGVANVPRAPGQSNSPPGGNGSPVLTLPAHYRVVDLGAAAVPAAINAHGEVVGTIGSPGQPFSFQNGVLTRLRLPAPQTSGSATDVNDDGVIAGVDGDALEWQPDGSVSNLGALANSFVSTVAISDTGVVLGISPNSLGIAECGGLLTQFFTNAPPKDVGPDSLNVAINAAGIAVFGDYNQKGAACTGTNEPAIYPGFTAVATPPDFTLDAVSTVIADINDRGTVVGYGPTTTWFATFYSQAGVAHELAPPAGYEAIEGDAINDADWIVGALVSPSLAHAFAWVGGKTVDLNTLLPANCNWTLANATDVNDSGYIVGTGTFNGTSHGFLLVPQ